MCAHTTEPQKILTWGAGGGLDCAKLSLVLLHSHCLAAALCFHTHSLSYMAAQPILLLIIIEYHKLEETHMDHQVQLVSVVRLCPH